MSTETATSNKTAPALYLAIVISAEESDLMSLGFSLDPDDMRRQAKEKAAELGRTNPQIEIFDISEPYWASDAMAFMIGHGSDIPQAATIVKDIAEEAAANLERLSERMRAKHPQVDQ